MQYCRAMTDARRRENLTTVTVGKDMNNPRNQQEISGIIFFGRKNLLGNSFCYCFGITADK